MTDVYEVDVPPDGLSQSSATQLSYNYQESLQANGASRDPSLTADGRFAAFSSDASNFYVPEGDTNGTTDVFIHTWQPDYSHCSSVGSENGGTANTRWDPTGNRDSETGNWEFEKSQRRLVNGELVWVTTGDKVWRPPGEPPGPG